MRNGLAIIEKNDTGTTGIYIDQEALEFARQNKRTEKHIAESNRIQRDRNRKLQKQKDASARRKAFNLNTAKWVSLYSVLSVSAAWAGTAGMIHPAILYPCFPVLYVCGVSAPWKVVWKECKIKCRFRAAQTRKRRKGMFRIPNISNN